MYHIKLIKGLSYTGIVEATKRNPDVYVEDKAIADRAVASGYFKHVSDTPGQPGGQQENITGHLDREQLDTMKFDDLKKLATDIGVDVKGMKSKAEVIEAISAVEVEAGAEDDSENEADYGEGQPGGNSTMIGLQEQ